MIDNAVIHIKSGAGGNGAISGRREKFVPLGGPDGGDGGVGGSVIFECDRGITHLSGFRYKWRFSAGNGARGEGGRKHGRKGDDIEVRVPVGTEIWEVDGSRQRLADMTDPGERLVVAIGGSGGRGNRAFAKSTNQFPLLAEEGDPGVELKLRLELKLLGDVGIIGAPNAGKSSLLAALTAARPKIAGYPFTTTEPVLGVAEDDGRSFVVVDIPGLIEGAHSGAGLGQEFLRHIERTRVLVHVVDGSAESPVTDYHLIRDELRMFNEQLLRKPEIVAFNKIDIDGVEDRCGEVREQLQEETAGFYCISAAARSGLSALVRGVGQLLETTSIVEEAAEDKVGAGAVKVLRPVAVDKPDIVRRVGRRFTVTLRAATRLAAMVDEGNWEARLQLYDQLRRLGVISALEKAGIRSGQIFRVGRLDWEWE